MAPKRSGKKRKVIGTVLKSTKKVIKETVKVAVLEGDTQESEQQDDQNAETEEIIDHQTNIKIIPVQESTQEQVTEEEEEIPIQERADQEQNETSRKQEQNQQKQEENSKKEDQSKKDVQEQEKQAPKDRKKKKTGEGKIGKKRKRRVGEGYKRYVYMVLKQVHPDLGISSMAMSIINTFMNDVFERIADEAAKLSDYIKRTTLSSREIQDAVKLVLPGELGRHAIAEGAKAISNYVSYEAKS
ncbi:uncharacterized protein LOC126665111 [Mercurialis annua]|uniref:uncharacterized protein LOC126665111 n=1 Tax=Mercurialis annua TaxID=3986 RepID=UPI00215F5CCD|nr:uncharacterized protein LOC126665111 [Mercurialis annua]